MYRDDLIRATQGAKNLTNEALADLSGLNVNTISAIRRGKEHVEVPTLKKVADALGLTMQQLFEPKAETDKVAA
jgi:transcriptional regulator with XRE-family HTH domain